MSEERKSTIDVCRCGHGSRYHQKGVAWCEGFVQRNGGHYEKCNCGAFVHMETISVTFRRMPSFGMV